MTSDAYNMDKFWNQYILPETMNNIPIMMIDGKCED
jgi:hypothetical protein